jgi:hypothetical protein
MIDLRIMLSGAPAMPVVVVNVRLRTKARHFASATRDG